MANKFYKNKNKSVDDAGIRLAPTPINNSAYHVMPTVMQEFVIEPTLVNKELTIGQKAEPAPSTSDDLQPKKEEQSKKWKRGKRTRNVLSGMLALIASLVVLLPYVLGFLGRNLSLPIKFVPTTFNALSYIAYCVQMTIEMGYGAEGLGACWVMAVPHLILTIGILAVLFNVIKSLFAIVLMKKQVKFTAGAIVNLLCVVAVLIASLVGAPSIGVEKIDFVQDIVLGYATSELFTLLALGVVYFIVCAICARINRDNCGYLN